MKALNLKSELPLLAIIMVPLIYFLIIWQQLPESIPTHFDLKGNANGWSSKNVFLLIVLFFTLGVYCILLVLPKIDPKKNLERTPEAYNKIRFIIILFMSAIACLMIFTSVNEFPKNTFLIYFFAGLFLCVLGNYFQTIKPNYFIGIRTPWTLESPDNWRKTHQIGGKIWFLGGLLIAINSLLLPANEGAIIFRVLIIIMVVVPVGYSFYLFKKQKQIN